MQFVSTVASSDDIFNCRPIENATVIDLLQYIIQKEAVVTVTDGSYSGTVVAIG